MTEEQKFHYFDWASTSPSDNKILQEALEISQSAWANPSSIHAGGKEARTILESSREKCASVLGVKTEQIYFTSGGTESNHIPLLSVLNRPKKGTVLLSSIEHPANREMASSLQKCGWKTVFIPSSSDGIITPASVEKCLSDDTVFVSIMAVNNETGAIQPVYEIAELLKKFYSGKRKPKFHIDCVQAAGKIPLNISADGIDSAAFSAHKISGPRGIGILYLKETIEPFLKGGGQEKYIRSGTENLFGAVAFSKCLEKYFIRKENSFALERFEKQKEYTSDFIKKLSQLDGVSLIPENRLSKPENYSPWVVQIAFKNIPGQVMLRALDADGFYISTGSACSAKKNNRPVLKAMHIPESLSETAVRFSFGFATEKKAMDELFDKVKEIYKRFNP